MGDSKTMATDAGLEVVDAEVLEAGEVKLGEGDVKLDESDPDYGVKFL